jgi:hypothetical protein
MPHEAPEGEGSSSTGRRLSARAKAIVAGLTAVVTLATGVLTLRGQLFPDDDPPPPSTSTATTQGASAASDEAITQDSQAKDRALRASAALRGCAHERGTYDSCATGGALGGSGVPIGRGEGLVQVEVDTPVTYRVTSRSNSGHVFVYWITVEGEAVRECKPLGQGGCPVDGRW